MFTMKISDLNLCIAQYNLWVVQYLTDVNWQYDLCLCTEIKSVTVAINVIVTLIVVNTWNES